MSLTNAMTRIAEFERRRRGQAPLAAASKVASDDARVPFVPVPPATPGQQASDSVADIFLSGAMPDDNALADVLEAALTARGYTVWRATGLVGGEIPHRAIAKALAACRAAIVLWTPRSVDLDWVYSEARRAGKVGKLIPVRTPDLARDDIPPPFDTVQTLLHDDMEGLVLALLRLGLTPRTA